MKLLVLALAMALVMVGGVMAAEQSFGASVGVNEIVDVTITDIDANGVTFGNFNPGTINNAAVPNPAVDIIVQTTTNVNVNVSLKGADWTGPVALTLAATNVRYDDDSELVGDIGSWLIGTLGTDYGTAWGTVTAPCGTGAVTKSVYHWLDVPANQHAGAYSSTFSYKASST